jgi:outer membrane immunogenic protein
MKRLTLPAATFGALIGPALAADGLEPAYREPVATWVGFYAGFNGGYTFNANNSTTTSSNNFFPGFCAVGSGELELSEFDRFNHQ